MKTETVQTPFDFRKELPELYNPGEIPSLIDVPAMRFITVEGYGRLYEESSGFIHAVDDLYKMTDIFRSLQETAIDVQGFYDYTYPPVEALWMESGSFPGSYSPERNSAWAVMMRIPDFVTDEAFELSCRSAQTDRGINTDRIYILEYADGPCVQMTQDQSYITDERSQELIDGLMDKENLEFDLCPGRCRHFIFLRDPRATKPEERTTIVRYPVFRMQL